MEARSAETGRADLLARLRTPEAPLPRAWNSRADLRDAAVLAPLFLQGGAPHLLLTRRRADLPDHPGQVAFPGGARDGGEDALLCALRESHEEVGIDPGSVDVLARLPDRVSIAGFMVAAFVGVIPEPRDLVPDEREVDRLFSIPLAALMEEHRWRAEDRTSRFGTFRAVPFFDWDGEVLWGLTGMFVRDLLRRLDGRPEAPPPAPLPGPPPPPRPR